MKTFQSVLTRALLLCIILSCSALVFGQTKKEIVKNKIANQNFIFKAQSVTPMHGHFRHLTSDYEVRVTKDSVVAFLPYFGRAYAPPANLIGGGINFKSKDFEYSMTDQKKGRSQILIKPKDVSDTQQLSFSISQSGYASLTVISNRREPISFHGYIATEK